MKVKGARRDFGLDFGHRIGRGRVAEALSPDPPVGVAGGGEIGGGGSAGGARVVCEG